MIQCEAKVKSSWNTPNSQHVDGVCSNSAKELYGGKHVCKKHFKVLVDQDTKLMHIKDMLRTYWPKNGSYNDYLVLLNTLDRLPVTLKQWQEVLK